MGNFPITPTIDPTSTNRALTGRGEANAIVMVYDTDGWTWLGLTRTNADGTWALTLSDNVAVGPHTVTVKTLDPAERMSEASAAYELVVEPLAPRPTIDAMSDDYMLAGHAEAHSMVMVYDTDGMTVLGTTRANADGTWELKLPDTLADGVHALTAKSLSQAGHESAASVAFDIVTNMGPSIPTIDASSTEHVLTGHADANTMVMVYDTNGWTWLGVTRANADGTWALTLSDNLASGPHTVTVKSLDSAGRMSEASPAFEIVVEPSGVHPTIDAMSDDHVLAGHAESHSTVTVYDTDGKTVLGVTRANADGTWELKLPDTLADGTHALTVKSVGLTGNVSESVASFEAVIAHGGNHIEPPVTPVEPQAHAVIDKMNKDTGTSDNDWVTNDGSAGRRIDGHVTQPLAADEKVQVSMDGGQTWQDAIMLPGRFWMAFDNQAHAQSWTIEARVINGAGLSTHTSVDVTLDITPPPALVSATAEHGELIVQLAKSGLVAGDTIIGVTSGGPLQYVLTDADIAAGKASISVFASDAVGMVVSVMDRAGNVSGGVVAQRGDGSGHGHIEPPVTPVDPQAHAVIDRMNKDTGTSDNDWVTNDGSAGRRIDGHVTQPLAADEKVQVSMDGGLTWQDALMLPGGAWMAFDNQWHAQSWTIEARVINGAGLSTHTSVDVTLDLTPPPALVSATVEHGELIVELAKSGLVAGDTIISMTGYGPVQYVLTDADIAAGKASVASVSPYDADAGIVVSVMDRAGNVSGGVVAGHPEPQNGNEHPPAAGGDGQHGAIGQPSDHAVVFTGDYKVLLTGEHQIIDFSKLSNPATGYLGAVDVVDLTGTGANTLKLSLSDVLNAGYTNLFHNDGNTQMMIKGSTGDVVDLSSQFYGQDIGEWAQHGEVHVNGGTYAVYENSLMHAEVLVQLGVATNLTH